MHIYTDFGTYVFTFILLNRWPCNWHTTKFTTKLPRPMSQHLQGRYTCTGTLCRSPPHQSKYIPLDEVYLISLQDVLCWEDWDHSTSLRVLCSVGEEHVPRARYPRTTHHATEASSPVSDPGQGRCQPGHGLGQTPVWNVRGCTGNEQADTSSVSR